MLERLSVHNKLVQEVELLLDRSRPEIVLLQALLDELFHLLVIQHQFINAFEVWTSVTFLLNCFEEVFLFSFGLFRDNS